MAKFLKFPPNFLWGGATAAEQIEGKGNTGKALTVWDEFYKVDPSAFYNKVGPSKTSDFFNQYKSDFALFQSFNVNSLRLSISWARLMPDGEHISEKGLKFYQDVITAAYKHGIKIVLNLFHFDMPLWAFAKGDWASKEVVTKFVQFANNVFKHFAHQVDYITTFNEPCVPVIAGYQYGNHWPRKKDNKLAFQVGYGIILAHAKVVKLFQAKYQGAKAKIGVVINVNPPIVKDGQTGTKADREAAKMFDLLHNNFWLYLMIKGEMPKGGVAFMEKHQVIPEHTLEDLKIIQSTKIDFLGVNYYAPFRVVASHLKNPQTFLDMINIYKYNKARYNVFRGWEIKPSLLYEISMLIKREFNIPFFIAENGMGVEGEDQFRNKAGMIEDNYRIAFVQEHLEELHRGIKAGANCFGYHMWSIIDNWSWRNAYKNRYGFVEVNLKDQTRKLKKSALWFKVMIAKNGFYDNYAKIEATIDLKNIKFTESV